MKCIITIILLSITLNLKAQRIDHLIDSLCTYPKQGKAIYKHESGHATSDLSKTHNNIFGFKQKVKIRGKYVTKYKRYNSVEDSVHDYVSHEKKWIDKYNITTAEQYLKKLSTFYAATNRAQWLRKIKKFL